MSGDYDLVLVSSRCSRCGHPVSAAVVELRDSGVFACDCGTMTRARYAPPEERTPFSHSGWHSANDSYHRTGHG